MTCGRVGSWKERPTFEELAVMFEGSTASGAERAYRKAVDKLTELLVAEGAIHAVRLKQKSKTRRKNHNHRLSRWFVLPLYGAVTGTGSKDPLKARQPQHHFSAEP